MAGEFECARQVPVAAVQTNPLPEGGSEEDEILLLVVWDILA